MKHDLKQRVRLTESGEEGVIIGRAEYTYAEPSYLIRYKGGDGVQHESWWTQDAIEVVAAE